MVEKYLKAIAVDVERYLKEIAVDTMINNTNSQI